MSSSSYYLSAISLALLLLFTGTPTSLAQQAARTGSPVSGPELRPDLPAAGELVYEYTRQQGDSSVTFGTIYESISRDASTGTFRTVIRQALPQMTMVDSMEADLSTYHPRRYRSFVKDMQDLRVRYDFLAPGEISGENAGETEVSMWREFPGQSVDTSMTVPTASPVYDFHWPHTLAMVLPQPEEEGDVANLPVFTYLHGSGHQPVSYAGEEEITLHGVRYRTLVWTGTNARSGTENTWWIDRESRRLVRSRSEVTSGVIFWMQRKASGDAGGGR